MNGHILLPRVWIIFLAFCLIAISCNLVTGLIGEESAQITIFDRQNGLLNIVERLAGEGDRSLTHVLRVN